MMMMIMMNNRSIYLMDGNLASSTTAAGVVEYTDCISAER